jgi:hypothetical protein
LDMRNARWMDGRTGEFGGRAGKMLVARSWKPDGGNTSNNLWHLRLVWMQWTKPSEFMLNEICSTFDIGFKSRETKGMLIAKLKEMLDQCSFMFLFNMKVWFHDVKLFAGNAMVTVCLQNILLTYCVLDSIFSPKAWFMFSVHNVKWFRWEKSKRSWNQS